MDFSHTGAQLQCQKQATEDAANFLESHDNHAAMSREAWRFWGNQGWLGHCVKRDYSGSGHDPLTTVIGFEALGKAGLSRSHLFSMGAHLFGCTMAVSNHGSDAQKTQWLPDLCAGKAIGALALTGTNGGSATQGVGADYAVNGDFATVNGAKTYVTNGNLADLFIVSANLKGGRSSLGSALFLVPRDTLGLLVEDLENTQGLKASPMSRVTLTNCILPAADFLGKPGGGLGLILSILRWERSCIYAGFLGALERDLIKVTVRLAKKSSGGDNLLKFQGVSHKLAEVRQKIEAARWLMYRSVWDLQVGTGPILYPALAKLTVSRCLVDSAMILNELMAGAGWTDELGTFTALTDVIGSLSGSGSNNIQLNAIGSRLARA